MPHPLRQHLKNRKGSEKSFARGPSDDVNIVLQDHASHIVGPVEDFSDPTGHAAVRRDGDFSSGEVRMGRIISESPHVGSYVVDIEDDKLRVATYGTDQSTEDAARSMHCLGDGTDVLVFCPKGIDDATILCVMPTPLSDLQEAYCDHLSSGSGVGFYVSPQYFDPAAGTIDAGAAKPYRGDRPYDAIAGDHTVMTTNGVGTHIDTEMAFLRTSEICGLFLFREDGHTRLSGESLEIESLSRRSQCGVSVYECFGEGGQSFYPWESQGRSSEEVQLQTVNRGASAIFEGTHSVVEPATEGVQSIDRIQSLEGYLAQGQLMAMVSPQGDGINSIDSPVPQAGLFRQQVLIDGTYLVESARQMFLAKTSDVPVIRRTAPRDYLSEDESYSYSGTADVGDDAMPHVVTGLSNENRFSLAAEEAYSYASGWQSLHVAAYHPHVEVEYRERTSPQLDTSLDQSDRISPPDAEKVKIDHRYGEVDIHRVLSFFALLPDGGVVLRNGLGAEIRLDGGAVDISGLSVNVNAAKNATIFGGKIFARANNELEMVSSQSTVRIKAQTDLNMLAAAGGRGGMLLESRSNSSISNWESTPDASLGAGIVLKSTRSHVLATGSTVLLKTMGGASGAVQGPIVIDAGSQSVIQRGVAINRYAASGFYDHYGTGPGSVRGTNAFNRNYVRLTGSLGVGGQLIIGGGVQAGDGYTTLRGHYASTHARRLYGQVGQERDPGRVEKAITDMQRSLERAKDYGEKILDDIHQYAEASSRPLNPSTIRRASFGFPSSSGYGASEVTLYEPYWARLLGEATNTWEESAVKFADGDETYPWPGKEAWHRPDGYVHVSTDDAKRYYDGQTAMPKNPKDEDNRKLYESAVNAEISSDSIKAGFKTLRT